MAKTNDYATLSFHVYNFDNTSIPEGWTQFLSSPDNNSYFGSSYINEKNKEIIIAHRGTEPSDTGDLVSDLQLALNFVPNQYSDAITFVNTIKGYTKVGGIFEGYTKAHTGHSLGGVLAQLSAATFEEKAATFDSTGTLELMEELGISYSTTDITSYVAAPNAINTTNTHIGDVVRIYNSPILEPTAFGVVDEYPFYTLAQHSIDQIVNQFNAITGEPTVYSVHSEWPSGGDDDSIDGGVGRDIINDNGVFLAAKFLIA